MSPGRPSESEVKCKLLWKLCRHNWDSDGIERDDLVLAALADAEQGRGRELVDELLDEPYVVPTGHDAFRVKNNPRAQARAAFRLRDTCGYSEIQLEAGLSRFRQAGGFDAFDREDVLESLDEWEQ